MCVNHQSLIHAKCHWFDWYRAINYDEKDPFLCNACGFCKYAKFDLTLTAKTCCAVDPIENEEDRKKVCVDIVVKPVLHMQFIFIYFILINVIFSDLVHFCSQTISTINSLLEKADRIYKQLQHHRPLLEQLLIQVTEHSSEKLPVSLPPPLHISSIYIIWSLETPFPMKYFIIM